MSSRYFIRFAVFGALLVGCAGSESTGSHSGGTTGSNGGTTGSNGGTTGTNGGTTGTNGGTTGSNGGTTGTNGGTTGTNGGTTGSNGGTTGTNGGTTGSNGGTTGSNGGTTGSNGGTTGTNGGTTGAGGLGPSDGCNQPPPSDEPIGHGPPGFHHDITVTGLAPQYSAWTQRIYCTTMPKGYKPDPTEPYPLLVYAPGCGGSNCQDVGLFTGHTDGMMVVQVASSKTATNPDGSMGCFQTGTLSTVDSPELNYFDQVVAEVSAKYCIDKRRIFVAGTSSGSWFSNYMACARGNIIRAIAPDSDGIPFDRPVCTGGAAAMQFPCNGATAKDKFGNDVGMTVARDVLIKANGCSMTSTPMKFGSLTCDYYGGCTSPIIYCATGGGHQCGQQYFSSVVLPWWMSLPSK
ncbi:MAG TPA: hypothetical protein VHJ20_24805 [Polyangia bacterium]|nr:hypothetical protein [Polyangia bacterium]